MNLENKRYLITGASSGLGLALVRRLLRVKNTQIVGVARNIKPYGRMHILSLDIANSENIEFMLDEAARLMGSIDCIIACAGFGYYEQFSGRDYGHIERIFQTNVLAPLYTLQRFLDKTNGKIAFVAISSMLGKFGLPGMALYSATKYALDGFHDSYRYEKPKRLHYMTVYPIGLNTHFWERIGRNIPLPRPLQNADDAALEILKGLQNNQQQVYTSPASKAALHINRIIPVFVPLYQLISKVRFDRWLKNH